MTLRGRRRWILALLLAAGLVYFLSGRELPPREVLAAHLDGLGPLAAPAAVALFAAASVFGMPGSLLVATTIWLFGLGRGLAVSGAGVLAAASGAFWIARLLGRERLLVWLAERHRWRRLDEEIGRYGGWIVLALRILPSLPFTVMNYLCGLTRVAFLPYLAATAVGMLPRLVLFAYASEHILVPAATGSDPWQRPNFWWVLAAAALFLVALPLLLRHLERQHRGPLAPIARIVFPEPDPGPDQRVTPVEEGPI